MVCSFAAITAQAFWQSDLLLARFDGASLARHAGQSDAARPANSARLLESLRSKIGHGRLAQSAFGAAILDGFALRALTGRRILELRIVSAQRTKIHRLQFQRSYRSETGHEALNFSGSSTYTCGTAQSTRRNCTYDQSC
jgi:hypothetical protein